MGMTKSYFNGVNKVCSQCVNDCKQFENVVLINYPKLETRPRVAEPVAMGKPLRAKIKG